ncbi:MAG: DUF169 domain-containing protein [Candidatus Nitrosocaldus sp.]|nr:DUF169 domain-containing protein [Candidatus Nitrosocaldus sp.]
MGAQADALKDIGALLRLENSPVAIRLDSEGAGPAGMREMMMMMMEERFTGYAPASCTFWRLGIDSSFYTVEDDHRCSIGKVTHGLREVGEVLSNEDVMLLTSIGWIGRDEIARLPRLPRSKVIHYTPVDGLSEEDASRSDLLVFFCNAAQAMLVVDAAERAGIEYRVRSKPTCAILAEAYSREGVAIGLGCTPSRLRTPYDESSLFVAIHSNVVERLVEHLRPIVKAEEFLHANKTMLV